MFPYILSEREDARRLSSEPIFKYLNGAGRPVRDGVLVIQVDSEGELGELRKTYPSEWWLPFLPETMMRLPFISRIDGGGFLFFSQSDAKPVARPRHASHDQTVGGAFGIDTSLRRLLTTYAILSLLRLVTTPGNEQTTFPRRVNSCK